MLSLHLLLLTSLSLFFLSPFVFSSVLTPSFFLCSSVPTFLLSSLSLSLSLFPLYLYLFPLSIHPISTVSESTVDCGSPPLPPNAVVTLLNSSTGLLALAEYSCRPGFLLEGDSLTQCQSNALWSGTLPTCASKCVYESKSQMYGYNAGQHVSSLYTKYYRVLSDYIWRLWA